MAAALTAVTTACSTDDDTVPGGFAAGSQKTYTMTVEATKGDITRALSLDGTTLNATWTAGDKVEVWSSDGKTVKYGTLTAQGSGASTTLKGEMDFSPTLSVGLALRLKFLSNDYAKQTGTLDYIANHCDYATAPVTVTSISGGKITTTAAAFENQQAIVKFTLKDGDNSLSATRLNVSDGTNIYTVMPEAATSELYVAIPGASTASGITLTAVANGTGTVYKYERPSAAFTNGKYYAVSVKMKATDYAVVDLGLPSGTLWATYNVGATKVEDYGKYFAWGETTGYAESEIAAGDNYPFKWKNYKHMTSGYTTWNGINKYTFADGKTEGVWYDADGNFIGDGKTTLDASDDAAYANWGAGWRMPTCEQQEELIKYCDWAWQSDYNSSGIDGYLVTSKAESYSGNTLFLPAAGFCYFLEEALFDLPTEALSDKNKTGAYWLSDFGSTDLGFSSENAGSFHYYYNDNHVYSDNSQRCWGMSVRPVLAQPKVAVELPEVGGTISDRADFTDGGNPLSNN